MVQSVRAVMTVVTVVAVAVMAMAMAAGASDCGAQGGHFCSTASTTSGLSCQTSCACNSTTASDVFGITCSPPWGDFNEGSSAPTTVVQAVAFYELTSTDPTAADFALSASLAGPEGNQTVPITRSATATSHVSGASLVLFSNATVFTANITTGAAANFNASSFRFGAIPCDVVLELGAQSQITLEVTVRSRHSNVTVGF